MALDLTGGMRNEFKPDFDTDLGILEALGVADGRNISGRDKLLIEALCVSALLAVFLYACSHCLVLLAMHREGLDIKSAVEPDKQGECHCRLSTEISDAEVSRKFEGSPTCCQLLSLTWSVVRAVGNLAFLLYAGKTIAPLDMKKPWDLEQHIVTYGEALIALYYLIGMTGTCLMVFLFPEKTAAKGLHLFKMTVNLGGNFSFLKMLPLANPVNIWGTFQSLSCHPVILKLRTKPTATTFGALVLGFASLAVLVPVGLSFAMMSVCIKVSMFGFIAEGIEWTPRHYFDFIFFVNALAGLRGDVEILKLNAVFGAMDDAKDRRLGFQEKVATKLIAQGNRFVALVAFTTMS